MARKITQEEIEKINELYLVLNNYSAVAREIGRAPSTVKKYVDSSFIERKKQKEEVLKPIDWGAFVGKGYVKTKEKTFFLLEKPGTQNFYILQNSLPEKGIKTDRSYNEVVARLMGFSFTDFINFCKESLGAEVFYGKNTLYPSIYFKSNTQTKKFIEVINFLIESKKFKI